MFVVLSQITVSLYPEYPWLCDEGVKEFSLFTLEKRRLSGDLIMFFPVFEGCLQRGQEALSSQRHGEGKGQQMQVALGEVSS